MKKGMKSFLLEFKMFAIKGSMIDLAVGVLIGGAFSKITASLVNDIAMPIVGILLGIDFSSWSITLPKLFVGGEENILNIGAFLGNIVDFIILALVVFLFVKGINRVRSRHEKDAKTDPPPEPDMKEKLLTEIRDLLKDEKHE